MCSVGYFLRMEKCACVWVSWCRLGLLAVGFDSFEVWWKFEFERGDIYEMAYNWRLRFQNTLLALELVKIN